MYLHVDVSRRQHGNIGRLYAENAISALSVLRRI